MASLKVQCAQQQCMVDLLIMEKDKTYHHDHYIWLSI